MGVGKELMGRSKKQKPVRQLPSAVDSFSGARVIRLTCMAIASTVSEPPPLCADLHAILIATENTLSRIRGNLEQTQYRDA